MKRRRVLFINHAAVLGGGELSLLELATAYRESAQVLLLSDGPFRELLEKAGVNVTLLPASEEILSIRTSSQYKALTAIPALVKMARHIARVGQGFELIHANSQKAFIVAALARLMGGVPVVWHLRDIMTANHYSKLNRKVAVNLANHCASRVLVNSQATGKAFIVAGGKPQLMINVSHGVNQKPFCEIEPEQCQRIRQELKIGDAPLVGTFSRLSYWKGQHILLEALKDLPEVHAMIVGEALFGEDEYVAKLKALAASPQLASRVHWLGFRRDVPTLMKACDIISHTSTEPEPFGRVIVEGLLAGKPVIATEGGGASELIQDRINGRLIPPNDSIHLAKTIREILEQPSEAAALAKRGFERAKTHFSIDAHLQTFDRTLANV